MKNRHFKITKILLSVFLLIGNMALGQVGIGTTTPDESSMLDIQSTSKGVLIPRMTSAQRILVQDPGTGLPATGLLVFDTETQSFWFYKGSWTELTSGNVDLLQDADGDTKIEVEQSVDQDKIHFSTLGSERMTIDDTGVTEIGTPGTNYTQIEADGTLVFAGEAEVWDDLRVSLDRGSDATQIGDLPGESNGAQIWYFRGDNRANVEAMSFTVQLPHSYKEGTNIYPHLHWTPETSGTGNIEWNLDYTWVNYDPTTPQIFPASTTSTVVTTGPFTQRAHMITGLTVGGVGLNGAGKKISSILMCRIWRDGDDPDDTYSQDAGLLSLDFHYQIDTVGSRTEYSK